MYSGKGHSHIRWKVCNHVCSGVVPQLALQQTPRHVKGDPGTTQDLPTCSELSPESQPTAPCSWPHQISIQRLHLFSDSSAFVPVFRTLERERLPMAKIRAHVPHPVAAHSQPQESLQPLSGGKRFGQ